MAPATNAKIIAAITEKQWSGRPAKDAGHQLLGAVIMMVVVCLFLMIFIPPQGRPAGCRHSHRPGIWPGKLRPAPHGRGQALSLTRESPAPSVPGDAHIGCGNHHR
jgi:hypothetical protein